MALSLREAAFFSKSITERTDNMKQALKKLSASLLAATILISFIPTAYADEAANNEKSTFDFSASDYSFDENDGTATIKITREGAGNAATKVSFKVADLVSEYQRCGEVGFTDTGRSEKADVVSLFKPSHIR